MRARTIITLLAIGTLGCGKQIELPVGEPLRAGIDTSLDEQDMLSYLVAGKPVTVYGEVRAYYAARFEAAGLALPDSATLVHLSPGKFREAYQALASHAAPEGLRGFTVREARTAKIVLPTDLTLAAHRLTFAHEVGHAYAAQRGGNRGELPAELVNIGVALAELARYPELSLADAGRILRAPAADAAQLDEYHLAVLASLELLAAEQMDLGQALERALDSEDELIQATREAAAAHPQGPPGLFLDRIAALTRCDGLAGPLAASLGPDLAGEVLDYLELGATTEALQARVAARWQGPEQGRAEQMAALGRQGVELNRGYPSERFPEVRRAHVYTWYAATWAETQRLDDAAALELAEEFIATFGQRFGQGGYLDRIAPEMLYLAAYAAAGLGQRCQASRYLEWMVTQYPNTSGAAELAEAAERMADSC